MRILVDGNKEIDLKSVVIYDDDGNPIAAARDNTDSIFFVDALRDKEEFYSLLGLLGVDTGNLNPVSEMDFLNAEDNRRAAPNK